MASEAECDQAFATLTDLLAGLDPAVRAKYCLDRTVSCRVPDLAVTWSARVDEDGLHATHKAYKDNPDPKDPDGKAQVRLTVGSDDLLALVEGRLAFPVAVATGKLRIQANPLDLLRLGSFL